MASYSPAQTANISFKTIQQDSAKVLASDTPLVMNQNNSKIRKDRPEMQKVKLASDDPLIYESNSLKKQ